jgi:NAD(P)-dependent dehydrogenase (short-subunit alcohol dehydrogenase family)
MSLAGRVVVITGAFGILGSALTEAAEAQGAKVALIDRADPRAGIGGALALGGVDLTELAAAEAAMKRIANELGGLDALLNIAGGFGWETLEGGSLDNWTRLFKLNVVTAATASRAALPHLKRSDAGRIVNVGSAAALKAGAGMGAYAASKSGVHRLTESLAEELKGDKVTVNAVLPSVIDTPTNRFDMPKADFSTWVAPADLATVILFLASPEARAITGALLPVTGRV